MGITAQKVSRFLSMSNRFYYLPAAEARIIRLFAPRGTGTEWTEDHENLPAIEYLDYGIMGGIRITSLSRHSLSITGLQVNTDFRPSLYVDRTGCQGREIFRDISYPVTIVYGESFFAITHAPVAKDWDKKCCYSKSVTAVTVSIGHGSHEYGICDVVTH